MKLRNPLLIRVAAVAVAAFIRVWMSTLRYRVVNHDGTEHPADADRARFIYGIFHEVLLSPVRFRGRVRVLISKHADGELIAQATQWLGFGVVRGSTTRGGGGALVELWDCSKAAHLIFTPDGPRGPRRRVQPGMVILSSRSGLPIVPVGVGYSSCWRAKSWDRFAVPKPFCRCVVVTGPSLRVPPDVERDGIEGYRRAVEERMLAATEEAERIAAGGPVGNGTAATGPHFREDTAAGKGRDAGTVGSPSRADQTHPGKN